MDRHRPRRSAWSRPLLTLWAAASLAACQALPEQFLSASQPEAAGSGWRVVERIGEARYLAPSMAAWEQVAAGSLIPAGSQVTTGIGGRLIVHQDADQVSAGTSSRFILPGREPGDGVHQTAGWVRYRVAREQASTFGIETPFLDLLVDDAVVDVTVGEDQTEVAVVSGKVRVKTLDGLRRIDLQAGYTGYASIEGDALAVRRGTNQALETVPPTVLPALHPDRSARRDAPGSPGLSAVVAMQAVALPRSESSAPAGNASAPRMSEPGVQPGGAASAPASASDSDAEEATGVAPPADAVPTPAGFAAPAGSEADAAQAEIRRRFDNLTAGLLDGLPPARPADLQSDRR